MAKIYTVGDSNKQKKEWKPRSTENRKRFFFMIFNTFLHRNTKETNKNGLPSERTKAKKKSFKRERVDKIVKSQTKTSSYLRLKEANKKSNNIRL